MLVHEGINFTFELQDGVALHTVVSRPDISFAEGAAAAAQMKGIHARLAQDPEVQGAIIDLSQAPSSQGPKTRATFHELVSYWEKAGKRLVLVIDEAQAILLMQLRRIVAQSAKQHGRVVMDRDTALQWLRDELQLQPTISSAGLRAIDP